MIKEGQNREAMAGPADGLGRLDSTHWQRQQTPERGQIWRPEGIKGPVQINP